MGAPYPILYNGLATSQGIWDTATTAVVPVGTRAALADGLEIIYHDQWGFPIVVDVDPIAEIVDDEYRHDVIDFVVTSPFRFVREATPLQSLRLRRR